MEKNINICHVNENKKLAQRLISLYSILETLLLHFNERNVNKILELEFAESLQTGELSSDLFELSKNKLSIKTNKEVHNFLNVIRNWVESEIENLEIQLKDWK